jgi:hypothetical protein
MSDLTSKERKKLEIYFEMGGGYLLDFSNNSLSQFISESVDIELYADKYENGSGSKANRMRAIWDLEINQLVGKLIKDIIEDDDEKILLYPHHTKRNQELKNHCLLIASRLENSNGTVAQVPTTNRPINRPSAVGIFSSVKQPPTTNVPISHPSAIGIFPPVQQPITQPAVQSTPVPYKATMNNKNKVFIVHGHDELAKEQLVPEITSPCGFCQDFHERQFSAE